MRRLILGLLVPLSLCACSTGDEPLISSVYQYVQSEDGVGMKAPITISVVPHIAPNQYIQFRIKAVDSDGRVYIDSEDGTCRFFDNDNFTCSINQYNTYTMNDGQLRQDYFATHRTYRKAYVVAGVVL